MLTAAAFNAGVQPRWRKLLMSIRPPPGGPMRRIATRLRQPPICDPPGEPGDQPLVVDAIKELLHAVPGTTAQELASHRTVLRDLLRRSSRGTAIAMTQHTAPAASNRFPSSTAGGRQGSTLVLAIGPFATG